MMREPAPGSGPFGLVAEFDEAGKLTDAVKAARKAGYRQVDAFSPFPVEGLEKAIGFSERRVPVFALAGAILGAASGYGIQAYANIDYPIDIGARPELPTPAFMLVVFELMVLGCVLAAVFGMLVLNRLPRLNHPIFAIEDFPRASSDRFFLLVMGNDARFDADATRAFLAGLEPLRVEAVPHAEEPE